MLTVSRPSDNNKGTFPSPAQKETAEDMHKIVGNHCEKSERWAEKKNLIKKREKTTTKVC